MIEASCPNCMSGLTLPEQLLGRGYKCPTCGTQFIVAEGAPPSPPVAAPPAPDRRIKPRPPPAPRAAGPATSQSNSKSPAAPPPLPPRRPAAIPPRPAALRTFAFPPLRSIQFPNVCVGCLAKDPTDLLKLNVHISAALSGLSSWQGRLWVAGGIAFLLIGGIELITGSGALPPNFWLYAPVPVLMIALPLAIGIIESKTQRTVADSADAYYVPICQECLSHLSPEEIDALDPRLSEGVWATNRHFRLAVDQYTVILTFTSEGYAGAFGKMNAGKGQIETGKFVVQPGRNFPEHLDLLLNKLLPHNPDESWYRRPNIPASILNTAITYYATQAGNEDVLAVADASGTKDGKYGCAMTTGGISYTTHPMRSLNKGMIGQGQGGRRGDLSSEGFIPWEHILKAIAMGTEEDASLRLMLHNGEEAFISCKAFSGVQMALQKLVQQVILFNMKFGARRSQAPPL